MFRVSRDRKDPSALVLYAEIEWHVWFNTNEMVPPNLQKYSSEEPQDISLDNIYMVDGS